MKSYILIWLLLFGLIFFLPTIKTTSGVSHINNVTTLESGAQYYSVAIDTSSVHHFVYLLGQLTDTSSSPVGLPPASLYGFKYQNFISLGADFSVSQVENVTNFSVYRYHYHIKIDEQGNAHTVFIANNYTLYYAFRNHETGLWASEAITAPNQWFALFPHLDLNANGEVRIVYAAIYNENAKDYFGTSSTIKTFSNAHLTLKKGDEWIHYDLSDNHGVSSEVTLSRTRQFVTHPGIKIHNGTAYIFYSAKNSRAAETQMRYLAIPEDPEDFYSETKSFTSKRWYKIFTTSSIASTFTTPAIVLNSSGKGIYVGLGNLVTGGAYVIYLEDPFQTIPTTRTEQGETWIRGILDPTRAFEVFSMSGIEVNGSAVFAWSLRDKFDTLTNKYIFDVFTASVSISADQTLLITRSKVTESELNIDHYTPQLIKLDESNFEISYITSNPTNGSVSLDITGNQREFAYAEGAVFGFIIASFLLVLITVGAFFLIKRLPEPKIEEELLPHQVNVKDTIQKEETL